MYTCSPAQRTLPTAGEVEMHEETGVRPLVLMSYLDIYCILVFLTLVRLLGVSGREVPSPDCLSPGANLIPISITGSARRPVVIHSLNDFQGFVGFLQCTIQLIWGKNQLSLHKLKSDLGQ